MTSENKNRLIAVAAILVAAGALAWIAFGSIGENLVYYWKPSEMAAQGDKAIGATVRLGGVVVPGTIDLKSDAPNIRFRVADSHSPGAANVEVRCTETPPQMFREGIGVVVEGTLSKDGVFRSSRLMVNHSNEYRAPTDGGTMPDEAWKESLSQTN